MDAPDRERAQMVWQQLAARNQWELIAPEGEDPFLDRVFAEYQNLKAEDAPEKRLRVACHRVYSVHLYNGIQAREERAAQEVWLCFVRLALRGGTPQATAYELAQEAVTRVIEKLASVRMPQSFLAWAIQVFRTVQRDLRPKAQEVSLTNEDGTQAYEAVDMLNLADIVETNVITQELADLLFAVITNPLERITLVRCLLQGDPPRDVAKELGLPLHRTRVAKARALHRLREHPATMARFASYVDTPLSGSSGSAKVDAHV
ncbi:sigma-70 family RNA polymerase sigma factor [Candidatus Chloroploca sp. M-50]|uniref:Sigma-70 family RNA polymerase sigma factor n=1 Tax=Candidatus Chloroploca mongolica TaxID=2528176 RepID=A0ABS4D4W6_9CHLR|nr:sigma-70 family RNA polymerase sigma factor [Candidatus Chloroploca mongolica]MBP1464479.1 sigma-70 family RNA polymerase sigma factor [Candidatus Chloroploca mongolica]